MKAENERLRREMDAMKQSAAQPQVSAHARRRRILNGEWFVVQDFKRHDQEYNSMYRLPERPIHTWDFSSSDLTTLEDTNAQKNFASQFEIDRSQRIPGIQLPVRLQNFPTTRAQQWTFFELAPQNQVRDVAGPRPIAPFRQHESSKFQGGSLHFNQLLLLTLLHS